VRRRTLVASGVAWPMRVRADASLLVRVAQDGDVAALRRLLDSGVRQYDEGNYKLAARNIQGALDAGLTSRSQARAHKYLAFIACVSGQQAQCREEFRQALTITPNLELRPEEAGHPTWGPVFRSVKASMSQK